MEDWRKIALKLEKDKDYWKKQCKAYERERQKRDELIQKLQAELAEIKKKYQDIGAPIMPCDPKHEILERRKELIEIKERASVDSMVEVYDNYDKSTNWSVDMILVAVSKHVIGE